MTEELSQRDAVRLAKLDELRNAGIEPYPARLQQPRTHTAAEAIAAFTASEADGENAEPVTVCVAGRMMSRRLMGKVGFAHIDDGSARLQLFVRRNTVGEETFDTLFKRLLDLGDFIAVCGVMMRTKTGEISVNASDMQLLSKSL
ncbi:MAG: lysine--tRNA ligase, partial [Anaerolineae bacterium]|nr:lysine--tRNA ligase [Anaerolineae bacterium]